MNIKTDAAGAVKNKDFEDLGFKIFETAEGSGMCGESWSIPQWSKDNRIFIVGGYWTWYIRTSPDGRDIWEGWWNTKEELEQTLKEIESQIPLI